MNIEGLDYNTQREQLVLPEYGREVQKMVDHAVGLPSKEERQHCAETIVAIMDRMFPQNRENPDYKQKLWDHLAISSLILTGLSIFPGQLRLPRSRSRWIIPCHRFLCAIMAR